MSDEKEKPNLKVLEFDKDKDRKESNEVVKQMLEQLTQRANEGDIRDFVITFQSESKGIESMIGGLQKGFDFIAYVGMIETLKMRLLSIMSTRSYTYAFKPKEKKEEKDEQKPEPET